MSNSEDLREKLIRAGGAEFMTWPGKDGAGFGVRGTDTDATTPTGKTPPLEKKPHGLAVSVSGIKAVDPDAQAYFDFE